MTAMTAMVADSIAVLAPAKINLYLHVLGRRPDGYHILDSLVVFAGCGDRIEVTVADALRLTIDGPFANDVPRGEDNLVLRAARALADEVGRPASAAIRLTKSLPVASGIGGGSSDAAATLRALLRLWRIDIDGGRLRRLALALGADVPMCMASRPSFVGGIGERIDPAPGLPPCALVLINPRVALPTAQVFAARAGPFSQAARFDGTWPADARELVALLAERRNDLAAAAMAIAPQVASVLDALAATPGVMLARMSGSGATCYGLCETEASAVAAARDLASRHPEWWIEAAAVAGGVFSD
jgi:4-diphosphocytidyl-2-C-methyl-D-erythritol kinase